MTKSNHRGVQRIVAVTVTAAVHIAIALPFFWSTAARPYYSRYDEQGGLSVSIEGDGFAEPSPAGAPPQEVFRELQRESWQAPEAAAVRPPSTALSDLWGKASAPLQAGRSQSSGAAATGRLGDPNALVSVARATPGARGSAGSIDGQATCWRKPPLTVPIIATLVLDENGGVIGRPQLARIGPGAGDDAEAIVWRALSGCAPYSVASRAGTYQAVQLDFSRAQDWVRPADPVEIR